MGALEPWHLIVILAIALIVFGPGKVRDLGGTLGRAVRDFRETSEGRTPSAPPEACVNRGSQIPASAKFGLDAGSLPRA